MGQLIAASNCSTSIKLALTGHAALTIVYRVLLPAPKVAAITIGDTKGLEATVPKRQRFLSGRQAKRRKGENNPINCRHAEVRSVRVQRQTADPKKRRADT
ncbi:hypothetical protein ZHAS_00021361 [Anopheles sinensis]|uniref:Uncharacterized protein n=1 Tax=Anopheles sinensis TaxID=74873 RepID=A0A084WS71_ANOSI|nr:hypothetical protein ZHAS_00021361 [Anopheles sinensis]